MDGFEKELNEFEIMNKAPDLSRFSISVHMHELELKKVAGWLLLNR
jgi:hypothetical protein